MNLRDWHNFSDFRKLAEKKLQAAKKIAEVLNNKTVDISQKAGVDGRLFGSVTAQDILEKINNDEISVNKSQISFKDGPIKSLGEHIIRISIHSEVTVEMVVNVISENQDENT